MGFVPHFTMNDQVSTRRNPYSRPALTDPVDRCRAQHVAGARRRGDRARRAVRALRYHRLTDAGELW
jgi:hypothetical protein